MAVVSEGLLVVTVKRSNCFIIKGSEDDLLSGRTF